MAKKITVVNLEAIEVVASEMGYYENKLREPGEKFFIHHEDALGSWMDRVDGKPNKAAHMKNVEAKVLGMEQTFPEPDAKILAKGKSIEQSFANETEEKKPVKKKASVKKKVAPKAAAVASALI